MRKAYILLTAAVISAASLTLAGPAAARGRDAGPLARSDIEARLGDTFSRLDANHDGLLSPADREAKFAERFAEADADGNGQLSLAEASAARDGGRDQWRERKAEGRKDRDGRRGEGRKGREGRHGLHSLIGMVRSADADGDKQISEAEFNTVALARFDRADADGDGTVTRAERRDAMRAEFGGKRMRFRN